MVKVFLVVGGTKAPVAVQSPGTGGGGGDAGV